MPIEIFIRTIQYKFNEIQNIGDDFILNKTRETFTGKCLDGKLIIKVIRIIDHGLEEYSQNSYPADISCDVNFMAEYKTYNAGELLLLRITDIKTEKLICTDKNFVALVDNNPRLKNLFTPQIGLYFIGVIMEASSANNGTTIIAAPYTCAQKFQLTRVANQLENTVISGAMELCINNIREICERPRVRVILNQFIHKKKATFPLEARDIFTPLKIDEKQGDKVLFVLNPYDALHFGKYYIATNENIIGNAPSILKTEACSLEYKIYKYCACVNNYIEIIAQISEIPEKEYDNNSAIWKLYSN